MAGLLAIAALLLLSFGHSSGLSQSALPRRVGPHTQPDIGGSSEAEADRVQSLPGWSSSLPGRLYAGYVTVDAAAGRQLFYSMAVSQRTPSEDPVILWLQGGPGCSGLGAGFLGEVGPFYASGPAGSELRLNNGSWAQVATVVFLESPAFTGFSTSNSSTDRSTDNQRTTADHVTFLQQLMHRFPGLQHLPLYLAGQSYAGHYVPLLAEALLPLRPKASSERGRSGATGSINLAGFLLGNPWTSPTHDNAATVERWYEQGLIALDTYNGLRGKCDFATGALWRTEGEAGLTPACAALRDDAAAQLRVVQTYGLNAPSCLAVTVDRPDRPTAALVGGNEAFDPCLSHKITRYLNRVDVQRALHALPANTSPSAPAKAWKYCLVRSDGVTYAGASLVESMLPIYPRLLQAGLHGMVYSGDTDCVVPTGGTRAWMEGLKLRETRAWRTWKDDATGQVAGHVISYEGLSLAVVRNAGHSVPYFQPLAALQLATTFLAGKDL